MPTLDRIDGSRDLLIPSFSGFGDSSAFGDGSADSSEGTLGEGKRPPLLGEETDDGTDPSSFDGKRKDRGEYGVLFFPVFPTSPRLVPWVASMLPLGADGPRAAE